MKKILWIMVFAVLLSGCAGPRLTGYSAEIENEIQVVIVDDIETRVSFRKAMESWLSDHEYEYTIVPSRSKYDPDKVSLEYVGHWSWDLALYLSSAKISAYSQGQKIGEVEFSSPNSLNFNKFGSAEKRVHYMMDVLFSKLSLSEANKLLRIPDESQGS